MSQATEADAIARTRASAAAGERARPDLTSALFALAALASGALLLVLGAQFTPLLDEWNFLLDRREFELDSLLEPHGEHIVALPVAIYKAVLALFGMESTMPFRVVSTAAFILSVALLLIWMRRRIDPWLALAGAILILFIGAGWEDLLWPFQVGFFGSMACGIGSLLALEREDRRGDLAAAALLTAAIGFSSLGVPFVAGAAVAIGLGPGLARRLFVVAVPAAVFAIWWLGWGSDAEGSINAGNVASAPLFVLDGLAASLSSLFGLSTPSGAVAISPLDWGRPLLVLAAALAAWRLWRLRAVPPWLWVVGAIALSFWLLAAFNEKPGRDAISSRYMYIGGIFCLMIAAELLRGVRPRGLSALAVGVAIVGVAVVSGAYYLYRSADSYQSTSDLIAADLAALEIARDHVEPTLLLSEDIADTGYAHVSAGQYLSAADAYGSPADTEAELAGAPEPARRAADKVLARALGLTFTPGAQAPTPSGPPPEPVAGSSGEATVSGSCATVEPQPQGFPAVLDLPAADAVVRSSRGSRLELKLRRFASDSFPVPAGKLRGESSAVLAIPADRAAEPWQLSVAGRGSLTVCGAP